MTVISEPTPITDVVLAFPASVKHLMPPMLQIPAEFRNGRSPWCRLARDWFANGLGKPEFHMAPGIDGDDATRHLSAILKSFEPKHEHKEAAVAYLASLWFQRVVTSTVTYPEAR